MPPSRKKQKTNTGQAVEPEVPKEKLLAVEEIEEDEDDSPMEEDDGEVEEIVMGGSVPEPQRTELATTFRKRNLEEEPVARQDSTPLEDRGPRSNGLTQKECEAEATIANMLARYPQLSETVPRNQKSAIEYLRVLVNYGQRSQIDSMAKRGLLATVNLVEGTCKYNNINHFNGVTEKVARCEEAHAAMAEMLMENFDEVKGYLSPQYRVLFAVALCFSEAYNENVATGGMTRPPPPPSGL